MTMTMLILLSSSTPSCSSVAAPESIWCSLCVPPTQPTRRHNQPLYIECSWNLSTYNVKLNMFPNCPLPCSTASMVYGCGIHKLFKKVFSSKHRCIQTNAESPVYVSGTWKLSPYTLCTTQLAHSNSESIWCSNSPAHKAKH